jgi:lipoyl(octanoyl) transferase
VTGEDALTPGTWDSLRADAGAPLEVLELGLVEYRAAWDLQRSLVEQRRAGAIPDTVVMLEHPPVFTLGRRADGANVLLDAASREAAGIDLVEVDRGGDVTYHGPGQLVVYPIVTLARVRHVVDFVRALEDVAITALDEFGIAGIRREGLTGVWVEREKLVAIGVRVGAGGITSHGLALNVDPDLSHFAGIVPCGITTEGVCSLASLGVPATVDDVRSSLRRALRTVFASPILDARPGSVAASRTTPTTQTAGAR